MLIRIFKEEIKSVVLEEHGFVERDESIFKIIPPFWTIRIEMQEWNLQYFGPIFPNKKHCDNGSPSGKNQASSHGEI